ncbi:glutamyl-tRNA amidotransferase subunit A [Aspergillus sclerotioniger CBS 115572]|uniref:Glutamyl-tRNA amidotransferase subunit A n=1 Tax=Aspergillus sclerotioniger CBS 115572 TaxID=1450535 RepID=A0A317X9G3_9EURO|nr:glutamyl-tRNA amidotransferase subunit A [Aspergillus sclerotioniger CBS 115572]PWY94257.1 glutamyl-tRNA amidotransferase subunit A [Aspergillus sclerotioniger CBS 115572]
MSIKERPSWQDLAQQVQAVRDRSIAQIELVVPVLPETLPIRVIDIPRQHLTPLELVITESHSEALVESLAAGNLTASSVTKAFLRRAAIARGCCIYELLPDRAISQARNLDCYSAKHGKPFGPLHGLPISVKAHIGLEGRDSSAGFVGWIGRKSAEDANVVKILLKAGAVIYARTTEPQGLVSDHLSVPRSGSGSIRSPVANCGLYGLKPSTGRVPVIGISAYAIGCETILGVIGPMSSTLGCINLFMKTLHPISWQNHESHIHQSGKSLTVGVMWSDGICRGLKEVVERLKLVSGIAIIEWKAFWQEEALEILTKLYIPDGGESFKAHLELSGEPYTPLTAWAVRDAPGIEKLSLEGVWDWTSRCEAFRYTYFQEWNSVAPDMDVILCPAYPTPAPLHDTSRYWGVVFSVTKVDTERDARDVTYIPQNEFDSWCYENYNPQKQKKVPNSLQLVAKRLEDEKLLQALKEIKEKLGLPFVDCLA